jgi:alpha-L-fucosidase
VQVDGQPDVWEACHTFSGSWGYHRDEQSWKSPEQLIHLLVDSVSRGGNLLMNVGPTALGEFDPRARQALEVYAEWLDRHSEAIYGCTQSAFEAPLDCRLTQNGNRVFIHIYAWPFRFLHCRGLAGKVAFARFLHDGSEIPLVPPGWESKQFRSDPSTLVLTLPVQKPPVVVPVIELTLA